MPGTDLIVWRKHPIDLKKKGKKFRTICEVLRELYEDAQERGDALSMNRLEEAHDMAKRMDRKMREYNRREPYIVSEGFAKFDDEEGI